jgi:hypothetical protein
MSVALFDLAQRMRAATLGRPVLRCAFAPVLPPANPIAVTVSGTGEGAQVRATDGARLTSAYGPTALQALVDLGVGLSPEPRTLVVSNRAALACLLELARATDRDAPTAAAAAAVGWWEQRAAHPGTGAVLQVTSACAARWALGAPPADDRDQAVWRRWLGVADPGPGGLLELADRVASGRPLPGLDACAEQDRASWTYFVGRIADASKPWDWRTRDNRREAALGLATRCDAAELYESLRLGDPLIATREAFGGTVVSGLITSVPAQGEIEVTLDRLACRLREDTDVDGYPGRPDQVPTNLGRPWFHGRVVAARVRADGQLVLGLRDVVVRSGPPRRGQRLTLRPRAVDPRRQRSNRQELHRRYAARRSWLSGGAPPAPRRRDVPLDVVIAAAES